jgi:hypothetical protein
LKCHDKKIGPEEFISNCYQPLCVTPSSRVPSEKHFFFSFSVRMYDGSHSVVDDSGPPSHDIIVYNLARYYDILKYFLCERTVDAVMRRDNGHKIAVKGNDDDGWSSDGVMLWLLRR